MLLYAIPLARTVSVEPAQSAGKIVLLPTEMMGLIVLDLALILEERVILVSLSVREQTHKDVKRTLLYGTLSVEMDSMLLAAVPARQIIQVACLILECHAASSLMAVELEKLFFVLLIKKKTALYVIISANLAILVMALSVGNIAQMACINVELSVYKVA